jgi:hypothetical protein
LSAENEVAGLLYVAFTALPATSERPSVYQNSAPAKCCYQHKTWRATASVPAAELPLIKRKKQNSETEENPTGVNTQEQMLVASIQATRNGAQ